MRNINKTILLTAVLLLAVLPMTIQTVEARPTRAWCVWGTLAEASTYDVGTHPLSSGHYLATEDGSMTIFDLYHFGARFYTSGVFDWKVVIYADEATDDHFTLGLYSKSGKTLGSGYTELYHESNIDATGNSFTVYPAGLPVNGQYLMSKYYGEDTVYIDHAVVWVLVNV